MMTMAVSGRLVAAAAGRSLVGATAAMVAARSVGGNRSISRTAGVAQERGDSGTGAVIVTGGSSGIGEAVARAFAQRGHTVYNFDVTHDSDSTYSDDAVRLVQVDMADEDAVKRGVDQVLHENNGLVDVLVNNVGIQPPASCVPLHTLPTHLWRKVLSVNLDSMYFASKATLPAMLERDLSARPSFTGSRGVIVNMASVQGVLSQPGVPAYAASKGAMLSLTRQMALEYGSEGIRVVAVNPGTTATPLVQELIEEAGKTLEDAGSVYPLEQRVAQPSEVGEVAYFLATPGASFVSGSHVDVDGAICSKGGWNT